MAAKTGDAATVHNALHEIIALHAVLVGGSIGEVYEGGLAESVVFQLPKIAEVEAHPIADGPIVVFALDGIRERPSLRVALDAGIGRLDVIHSRRVQDIAPRGMLDMLASRAVTLFAADVPLRNLLAADVVIDGVAAIAGGAGGALHVVWRVEGRPPIGAVGDEIGAPDTMVDVPLSRLGKIVVASFGEIALLPDTAVDQGDLILSELGDGVGGKIRNDGVGRLPRIANDVGHERLAPVLVDLRVAFLAGRRAEVVSGTGSRGLLGALLIRWLAQGADEQDQFPTAVGLLVVRVGPAGHAGKTHAIADDVADFAVGEILGLRRAKVRNFGIEIAADCGLTGAVRAMADGARSRKLSRASFSTSGVGFHGFASRRALRGTDKLRAVRATAFSR